MTDKEYREQKRRIEKIYAKWYAPLGIGWYEVTHVWSREQKSEGAGEVAAETNSDWRYRWASITWYLPAIKDMKDQELERSVVHELVHILLDPLSHNVPSDLRDQMELATHSLAIAFRWVRDAGNDKRL